VAVRDAVQRAGLPAVLPAGIALADVVAATLGDKKSRGGRARYALPRSVGEMEPAEGRYGVEVDDAVVCGVLESMQGK